MRSAAAGLVYADCTTPASSIASCSAESLPFSMRLSTVSMLCPSAWPATMSPASTARPSKRIVSAPRILHRRRHGARRGSRCAGGGPGGSLPVWRKPCGRRRLRVKVILISRPRPPVRPAGQPRGLPPCSACRFTVACRSGRGENPRARGLLILSRPGRAALSKALSASESRTRFPRQSLSTIFTGAVSTGDAATAAAVPAASYPVDSGWPRARSPRQPVTAGYARSARPRGRPRRDRPGRRRRARGRCCSHRQTPEFGRGCHRQLHLGAKRGERGYQRGIVGAQAELTADGDHVPQRAGRRQPRGGLQHVRHEGAVDEGLERDGRPETQRPEPAWMASRPRCSNDTSVVMPGARPELSHVPPPSQAARC